MSAPSREPVGPARGRWLSPRSAEQLGLLRPRELAQLRELGSAETVETGTVVAAAGSRPTHVQVVATGEIELKARVATGRVTLAVVRTGGVVADIPLLLDAPMPFDAVASRDTELLALSRERWTRLLTSSPSLSLRWMTSIAQRLDADRRRLLVVTSRPLRAQVAYLLLDLAERDGTGDRVVRLSHTTLAHLLGARRQSVSRVMAELRRDGLVENGYGVTLLRDEPGLHAVMGPDPLP